MSPPWTQTPGNGPFRGSNDNGAVTVLEATTRLTCAWVGSNGGGDVGLIGTSLEGVWSATRWSNVVADGCTHDIATSIFG